MSTPEQPGATGPEDRIGAEGRFSLAFASLHGHQIGYRYAGRGPTLLLLHGIAGSSRTWLPAMQLLRA